MTEKDTEGKFSEFSLQRLDHCYIQRLEPGTLSHVEMA